MSEIEYIPLNELKRWLVMPIAVMRSNIIPALNSWAGLPDGATLNLCEYIENGNFGALCIINLDIRKMRNAAEEPGTLKKDEDVEVVLNNLPGVILNKPLKSNNDLKADGWSQF